MQKKSPGDWVKLFFTLLKLNITFYFKCYLHLDCSVNLNWNNTHIYSSAKPLCNVPGSLFWFENFCFLPILCRTRVQKWKKNWFCYVHKWIGKKEMTTKISKCLCRNLFIRASAQIRAVLKDQEILVTLKRCIPLSLTFQNCNTKFPLFYDCRTYKSIFRLFDDSSNRTKDFNLKVNCKELRIVLVYHVNTEYT